MAITVDEFRTNFSEFKSTEKYPDGDITFWLGLAALMLNARRWGRLLDYGTQMFVAHHLVLEAQAKRAAAAGGIPGTQIGIVNSKSVDKVSVGYDVNAALASKDAGHWSMSTYGLRFWQLVQMVGAGPIHVGAGCLPGALSSANAWQGIWQYNFPNQS